MKYKIYTPLTFLLLITSSAFSQSTYAPLNDDYYHWIDRLELKRGEVTNSIFTSVKPYKRSDIATFLDSANQENVFTSSSDQFNYEYLANDNWEWTDVQNRKSSQPVLKHFYKVKSDFYHVKQKDFDLHINPVLYLSYGKDSRRDENLFVNTRGVEIRGMLDDKLGFYTYLTDNQVVLPLYVNEFSSRVVPHEGFFKRIKNNQGYDYLQARGYISFDPSKHITLQFGHDRFFLGHGYRSLAFSDFSPPALFFKGNLKVWKLNYVFQVNQMTADNRGANGYPIKFNALHHLSINLGKKFNLGIFESVIFSPDDTTGTSRFRMEYLNPIIFYRAIEQQNGSTDNVLLGADFKWLALKKISVYGQFLLDEMVIDSLKAGNGWWANKFGIQGGLKYVDAIGISNLDLQAEVNIVRPFTYSHFTNYGSYSNYNQPIAHPLGASFKEFVGIVRYQPLKRLNLVGKLIAIETGRDSLNAKRTWGSDILKNNQKRLSESGNKIGQGFNNQIVYMNLTTTWQLKQNVFIDADVLIRRSTSKELNFYNHKTSAITISVRINVARRLYEF